jgi:hypothetical protein
MFVDYMKGLWVENIEVELLKGLPKNHYMDKYFVRIKKRL